MKDSTAIVVVVLVLGGAALYFFMKPAAAAPTPAVGPVSTAQQDPGAAAQALALNTGIQAGGLLANWGLGQLSSALSGSQTGDGSDGSADSVS